MLQDDGMQIVPLLKAQEKASKGISIRNKRHTSSCIIIDQYKVLILCLKVYLSSFPFQKFFLILSLHQQIFIEVFSESSKRLYLLYKIQLSKVVPTISILYHSTFDGMIVMYLPRRESVIILLLFLLYRAKVQMESIDDHEHCNSVLLANQLLENFKWSLAKLTDGIKCKDQRDRGLLQKIEENMADLVCLQKKMKEENAVWLEKMHALCQQKMQLLQKMRSA